METYLNAKPIFLKEGTFHREENKGNHLYIKYGMQERLKLVNNTANEIVDYCDGENTVKDIIDNMKKEYPNIDQSILARDIKETLVLLERSELIDWKNTNPFIQIEPAFKDQIDDNTIIYKATPLDFKMIYENIVENFFSESNSSSNTNFAIISPSIAQQAFYNEVIFKYRFFNFSENVYLLKSSNITKGIVGVIDEFPIANRAFSSFWILNDLDDTSIIVNSILKDIQTKITKFKCCILAKDRNATEFVNQLEKNGFIKEAILKHEYGPNEDEIIISKLTS